MLFAGLELARRLEGSEAAATGACAKQALAADPSCGACVEGVAGGWAICFGASSPLNKCVGVGLYGPVSGDDLDKVETVFRSRGAKVVLDLCPLADTSLIELLSQRSYTIAEIENVLAMEVSPGCWAGDGYGKGVEVRLVPPDQAELWSRTLGRGFSNGGDVSEEMVKMGIAMYHTPGARPYLAYLDDAVAGGGGMSTFNRVAALYGTAVLPEFRGRGVQTALLHVRLADAVAAGCDLAKIATRPGTTSQRNAERQGFRVVYTKPQMTRG